MRKQITAIAHKIKPYYPTFDDALQAATIIAKLHAGYTVEFTFAKSSGEVRIAKAIAMGSLSTLDKGFIRFLEQVNENKTQWRSFRLEHLIF